MADFMDILSKNINTSNVGKLNDVLFAVTDPNNVDDKTILDVDISKLHTFENHPFKVKDDDEKMLETIDSIREQGVIYPIIIRPKNGVDGEFEIVAGHRRKRACELIGLETIPAIVKKISDEESTIIMVDSNIQREELLFSEKAFAYKMKLDAIKQQGKRTDLTCTQVGYKLENKKSITILADNSNDSRNQIQRYIRLTYLIKELLDMVDEKSLAFTTAVELSYINEHEQKLVFDKIAVICKPSLSEAKKFKEESTRTNGGLTAEFIEAVLLNNFNNSTTKENTEVEEVVLEHSKPQQYDKPLKSMLKKRKVLSRYFKDDVEEEEIEDLFIKLLEMHYADKID